MNANIKTLISHVKNYMTQHEKNKKGNLNVLIKNSTGF